MTQLMAGMLLGGTRGFGGAMLAWQQAGRLTAVDWIGLDWIGLALRLEMPGRRKRLALARRCL